MYGQTFFPYLQFATRQSAPQRVLTEMSRLRGRQEFGSEAVKRSEEGGRDEVIDPCREIDQEMELSKEYVSRLPSLWNLTCYPKKESTIGAVVPSTLSINVTEQCNIACTYCYFTGGYKGNRTHNSSEISEETAAMAISHFFSDSLTNGGRVPACLYLFGGEPLLAEKKVNFIIQLAAKLPPATVISMASNGMLLNHDNVKILEDRAVTLAISIDGPSHDRHRVFRNGTGSKDVVIEKIDWLYHNYHDFLTRSVSTSCVVTDLSNIDELFEFFYQSDSLRSVIHWDFDILLAGSSQGSPAFHSDQIRQLVGWYMDHVLCVGQPLDLIQWRYFFASGFNAVHRTFWSAANWYFAPRQSTSVVGPLGTYVSPGSSMVTLRPGGDLFLGNERQKDAYRIGRVEDGISPDRVRAIEGAFSKTIDKMGCSHCWAAPMCTLSIVDFDIEDFGDDSAIPETYLDRCSLERAFLSEFLEGFEILSVEEIARLAEFVGNELSEMR